MKKKLVTDVLTGVRTDRPTDTPSYRDAWMHLKRIIELHFYEWSGPFYCEIDTIYKEVEKETKEEKIVDGKERIINDAGILALRQS